MSGCLAATARPIIDVASLDGGEVQEKYEARIGPDIGVLGPGKRMDVAMSGDVKTKTYPGPSSNDWEEAAILF